MNKLTEQQKKDALAYMNKNQDFGFDVIASDLSMRFGVLLTGAECYELFVESAF